MKNKVKSTLVIGLCTFMLPMAAMAEEDSSMAYSVDFNDYAGQWEYAVDEATQVPYYWIDVVYCSAPVDPTVQHMVVYVPAAYMQEEDGMVSVNLEGAVTTPSGVTYTTDTAPIIYTNTSGGYSSSVTTGAEGESTLNPEYMQQGYVQVAVGTRGKETMNEAGEYIGQFPLIMVDLKAGIRYLKANDAVLPGNSQHIVSHGYSSGGAVGVLLGASGNSEIFTPYLEEIGAADATDDIFAVLGYAPITGLDSADAAYEWFQAGNTEYFLFNSMAYDINGNSIEDVMPVGFENFYQFGSNILGGAHEDELSALLYNEFVEYVRNFGLDLGEDGRSGSYFMEFVDLYSASLTEFLSRYEELDYISEEYPTAADYLAHLQNDMNSDAWLNWDEESQTATVTDFDAFMNAFINRNKMCPSLDSYNYRSNENIAFAQADGTIEHFSALVKEALDKLVEIYESGETDYFDGFAENDSVFTEADYEYLKTLADTYDAEVTEESNAALAVMSPVNYIVNDDEYWESTLATYWRFQVGSADGDHGLPEAWLTHEVLQSYAADKIVSSEIAVIWDKPHTAAEFDDQDLYDYIDSIMAAEMATTMEE